MVHVICADASTTHTCCRAVYCFDICTILYTNR